MKPTLVTQICRLRDRIHLLGVRRDDDVRRVQVINLDIIDQDAILRIREAELESLLKKRDK